MAGAVEVEGIAELQRAFARASKELSDHLQQQLVDAAQPVADTAKRFALGRIRNMPRSPDWAEMRVGVARRQGDVYVVPFSRSRGGGKAKRARPNLAGLLMTRSLEPALDDQRDEIVRKVDQLVDRSLNLSDLS